jgi:hypothetical protein
VAERFVSSKECIPCATDRNSRLYYRKNEGRVRRHYRKNEGRLALFGLEVEE